MSAHIIDGNLLSKKLRAEVAERAAALTQQGRQPGLAVVLVGDNPASQVYVRNKIKACEDNGLHSVFEKYDASLSEAELLARIDALNHDRRIHGILVQLPLPAHIDAHKVIEAIAPEKDVDGFHISNAGLLMTGQPLFRPCTPYGVMKMLESIDYPVRGAQAVVVEDFNLAVERGEFISFLGPSGCGKTTTLRMIAGLIEPTSGRIRFDDQDVTWLPPRRRS